LYRKRHNERRRIKRAEETDEQREARRKYNREHYALRKDDYNARRRARRAQKRAEGTKA
jgi:hypothetical protein